MAAAAIRTFVEGKVIGDDAAPAIGAEGLSAS
jgi:hypothetical protein